LGVISRWLWRDGLSLSTHWERENLRKVKIEARSRGDVDGAEASVGYRGLLKILRISCRVRNNGKSATDSGRRWINNEKLRASQLEDKDLQRV